MREMSLTLPRLLSARKLCETSLDLTWIAPKRLVIYERKHGWRNENSGEFIAGDTKTQQLNYSSRMGHLSHQTKAKNKFFYAAARLPSPASTASKVARCIK